MVAMNVERINETRTQSHYVRGVAFAVSLMTESEQTIAVTSHRVIGTTLP